ncbi:MAG: Yip1 family protein [Gemmatimonadaceae bacterium]
MNLVERAKNIIMTPKQEWAVIDAEPLDVGELLTKYVLPLAAIGPIAVFIGTSLIGIGPFRVSIGGAIWTALTSFVLAIIGVFAMAWVISTLAPSFGGERNMPQAIKVAAYSATPQWIAGIFGLIPALWVLMLVGGVFSLYLFYLGLPVLMKVPQEKAMVFTVVVIVVAVLLFVVVGALTTSIAY